MANSSIVGVDTICACAGIVSGSSQETIDWIVGGVFDQWDDLCNTASAHGLLVLHRCVNKPQVCKTAAKQVGQGNALSLATNPGPAEVYSSQASCCRAGLGAFADGCSFDA